MTDRITGGEEGDALTPDDEAAVQRMLAEAAGPERTPDDVVARLDAALDRLVAERSPGSHSDEDDQGARVTVLRARRWPRALLAAAAVLVVGYGVGTVASQGTLSGSDSQSTADEAVAGSASEESGAQDSARGKLNQRDLRGNADGADSEPNGALAESPQELDTASDLGRFPPRVRSERLDVGVRRALVLLDAQQVDGVVLGYRSRDCRPPDDVGRTDWIPVRYDARQAVLVGIPAAGDLVEVTIYSCQGAELDRTLVERPAG